MKELAWWWIIVVGVLYVGPIIGAYFIGKEVGWHRAITRHSRKKG